MFEQHFGIVTPYLPESAKIAIKRWREKGRIAFIRPVERKANADCENCQDIGYLFVSFAEAGPFKTPNNVSRGAALTYLAEPGYPESGVHPGWYSIKETRSYRCLECEIIPEPDQEINGDLDEVDNEIPF